MPPSEYTRATASAAKSLAPLGPQAAARAVDGVEADPVDEAEDVEEEAVAVEVEPGEVDDEAWDAGEEDPHAAIATASPNAAYRAPIGLSVRGVRRPSK